MKGMKREMRVRVRVWIWNILIETRGGTLQGRVREKRYPHVGLKEHHQIPIKKQQMMMMQQGGRVFDVTETGGARKLKQNDLSSIPRPPPRSNLTTIPKPVDEDLYKIPPELLHSSKRVFPSLLFHLFFLFN